MTTWSKIQNRKKKKSSKSDKRFLSQLDMAEAKHMEAKFNGEAKREKKSKHKHINVCGCGVEGCIFCS